MRDLTSLDSDDARELLDLFVKEAKLGCKPISLAVVDASGNPLAQHRMPGAKVPTYAFALCKAQSAIRFECDTVEFGHTCDPTGNWHANESVDLVREINRRIDFPNLVTWAGGVLVDQRGHAGPIQGAVGISGLDQLVDHELAKYVIEDWLGHPA